MVYPYFIDQPPGPTVFEQVFKVRQYWDGGGKYDTAAHP